MQRQRRSNGAELSCWRWRRSHAPLAISRHQERLFRSTPHNTNEVSLEGIAPHNLQEFLHTRQPDHLLEDRMAAGPSVGSMQGVVFGTNPRPPACEAGALTNRATRPKRRATSAAATLLPQTPRLLEIRVLLLSGRLENQETARAGSEPRISPHPRSSTLPKR
jgi:hypothetical protein